MDAAPPGRDGEDGQDPERDVAAAGNPAHNPADDPAPGDAPHAHRRGDTRARIQQVALELFAEQGYERTSLREIAERLGVTKAALYYHFKSKEDIVRSFTEDHFGRLDALIAWGRDQPRTARTGHEVLDRYITILLDGSEVFLFLERNQASLSGSGTGSGTASGTGSDTASGSGSDGGKHRFEQFRPRLDALVEIITGPNAQPRSRIRAAAAIFAASASCMFFMRETLQPGGPGTAGAGPGRLPDRNELREIVLELADDLTSDIGTA